jgi:DNA-binding NarL/FixJ family response regulator
MIQSIIRVAIADRNCLWLEGMKLVLQKVRHVTVVGLASNGADLIELSRQKDFEIIITDSWLPEVDGIEAIRKIRKFNEGVKIICFTSRDQHRIIEVMDAGANACVAKCASKNELLEAIKNVMKGRNYYCDKTSRILTSVLSTAKRQMKTLETLRKFNARELEIIGLICQECASKEIAHRLQLAHRTVEKYRERIMEKTGSQNVVGIVLFAIRHNIFRLE